MCNRFDRDPKPHHFLQLTIESDHITHKVALHATVQSGILSFQQTSLHLKHELKAVPKAKSTKISERSKYKLSFMNEVNEQKKAVWGNRGRGSTFCASSVGAESAK